jgi:hypothetical protein
MESAPSHRAKIGRTNYSRHTPCGLLKVVDFGSLHGARFCPALVAAAASPEGASVHPAKGEVLVQRPHHNPFKRPAHRAKSSSSIPRASFVNSGELLARWAEHRKAQENITRGAADIPGLRPSLDERLGLRPGWLPILLRGGTSLSAAKGVPPNSLHRLACAFTPSLRRQGRPWRWGRSVSDRTSLGGS